jgi:signal transduction histidine kinase/CheY-like chemotaxis protein
LVFVTDNQPEMIIFLVATILGIISTMLPVLSTYLPAFYIFSVPIFLSLIYRFYTMGMTSPALSIGLCITTSLIISYHCHRSINQNLEIAEKSKKLANKHAKKRHIAERKSKNAIKENISKSKFIGTASHDLQQPLHAMGLCLEALEFNLSNPKEGKVILDQLRLCHTNFIDMFTSTMEFTSLDFNHRPINKTHFDIKNIITPLVQEFDIEASMKGIKFFYHPTSIIIFSEANLIRRLIRNLLSNAVKYSDSGSIHIKTQIINKAIQLSITDHGIGISKEHLSSIFDYTFQLNNAEKSIKNGAGLGLAIVHKINRLLNLKLAVSSKIGKGTQFRLRLPLSTRHNGSSPLPKKFISNASEKIVLVIENDARTLEVINAMLKASNCVPLLARSIQEAQELIPHGNRNPDLILSNYHLDHDESGIDAIKQLRAQIGKKTPAIVVTGDTCSKLARTVRNLELMIMYKPISMGPLNNALKQCGRN